MHKIAIPSYAVERVMARRGRLHRFAAPLAGAAE